MKFYAMFLTISALFLISCSSKQQHEVHNTTIATESAAWYALDSVSHDAEEQLIRDIEKSGENYKPLDPRIYNTEDFKIRYEKKVEPPPIDYNKDLTKLSLEELRYLKFELYARKGYLFHDAALRNYFDQKKWYQPIYWTKGFNIKLNDQEEAFFRKIKQRESELIKRNYRINNGVITANIDNLINTKQFKYISDSLKNKLKENGFAISKARNNEIYQVYEHNDYNKIPSFITTDAYLQIFHEYFVYVLRTLEENYFSAILEDLTKNMYKESMNIALANTKNQILKETAEFNAFFFALANNLLTNDNLPVPERYKKDYDEQRRLITEANKIVWESPLFEKSRVDYSIFKPRGNYTRSEKLRRYFKAMMWFGTTPFPYKNDKSMARLVFASSLLNSKTKVQFLNKYLSIYEPLGLLIGENDNPSSYDIIKTITSSDKELSGVGTEKLLGANNIHKIRELLKSRINVRIIPGGEVKKVNKEIVMNFLPQRYTPDAEIFARLVSLKENKNERREMPRGLDVLAAFGNKTAEGLLLNFYKENTSWIHYSDTLNNLKKQFSNYYFDKNVYSKWIQGLNSLSEPDNTYPYYMKLPAWSKKNINTSLASWAELKHDAILYVKQPYASECGDGEEFEPPPPPVPPGYVEPNIHLWERCLELLDLTSGSLKKYNLLIDKIKGMSSQLKDIARFLHDVSIKELKRENLSSKEYETIRLFGSTAALLTNDLRNFPVEAELRKGEEDEYSGVATKEEMPVIADVYTVSTPNRNDCMEVATGYGNEIYVVVEIEGYLYLTRGCVFSYYEFAQPLSNRLTDEQWRSMLEKNLMPDLQPWMLDLFVPPNSLIIDEPASQPTDAGKRYTYSSGC